MSAKTVIGVLIMMFALVQVGNAAGKEDIQEYFNNTSSNVKATDDPIQKREILSKSLQTMSNALDSVERSELISQDERAGIDRFKTALQEKQNELTGSNGYERVSDAQLDDFSDYVLQDMEQAERYITVSVVTALLIVIIILLIV